jgi:hypothetical protein
MSSIKDFVAFSSLNAVRSSRRVRIKARGYVDGGRSDGRVLRLINHSARSSAITPRPPKSSAKKQIKVENGAMSFEYRRFPRVAGSRG